MNNQENVSLLEIDDRWNSSNEIFQQFKLLQEYKLFNAKIWRAFHCLCTSNLGNDCLNKNYVNIINDAMLYIEGKLTLFELKIHYDSLEHEENELWDIVKSTKLPDDEKSWQWPMSRIADQAWANYCITNAVRTCVSTEDSDVLITTIPDAAASVRAWKDAGPRVIARFPTANADDLRRLILQEWELIYKNETANHAQILRQMVIERKFV